jgi:hypothetical protein
MEDRGGAVPRARGELEFSQVYDDDFVGWPLAPIDRAHGVYGTFLNPTTAWPSGMPGPRTGYHQAIDILVDDRRGPQPVFAIEGGRVREAKLTWQTTPLQKRLRCGVVGVGHFRYAHVSPTVAAGDVVAAGQEIGRTCPGWWHVHLEELAHRDGRRMLLNPLRPGGKLAPVRDAGRPFISALRIYPKEAENDPQPRVLPRNRVRGVVVPVALAMDRFPLKEWPGAPTVPLHVYRAQVALEADDGTPILERTLFQIDSRPGPTWEHFFRPLTRRSAPVAVCIERRPTDCGGRFWLRLWERGWDTRGVRNGWYRLALTVEDTVGRRATRTVRLRVAN